MCASCKRRKGTYQFIRQYVDKSLFVFRFRPRHTYCISRIPTHLHFWEHPQNRSNISNAPTLIDFKGAQPLEVGKRTSNTPSNSNTHWAQADRSSGFWSSSRTPLFHRFFLEPRSPAAASSRIASFHSFFLESRRASSRASINWQICHLILDQIRLLAELLPTRDVSTRSRAQRPSHCSYGAFINRARRRTNRATNIRHVLGGSLACVSVRRCPRMCK